MKVLILTAKFGMGHYSVSEAIRQQIDRDYPGAEVQVQDVFAYVLPKAHKLVYGGFHLLVKRLSTCYNFYYRCTENSPKEGKLPFSGFCVSGMKRMMQSLQPDVVVSTHPFCAQLISRYTKKHGGNHVQITCITDMSSHREWINPGTDMYFVASRDTRSELLQKGIRQEQIYVTGIPVRQQFYHEGKRASSVKQLLIMGGGFGLLPESKEFYAQLNAMENVQTTVIVGSENRFYHAMKEMYSHVKVLGFVRNVDEYMRESDLLLSKPGGITMFEAIHSKLPMLVVHPFLQQEMNNAAFIESRGLGKVIWEKRNAIADIYALLHNERLLGSMRAADERVLNILAEESVHRILKQLERTETCA